MMTTVAWSRRCGTPSRLPAAARSRYGRVDSGSELWAVSKSAYAFSPPLDAGGGGIAEAPEQFEVLAVGLDGVTGSRHR